MQIEPVTIRGYRVHSCPLIDSLLAPEPDRISDEPDSKPRPGVPSGQGAIQRPNTEGSSLPSPLMPQQNISICTVDLLIGIAPMSTQSGGSLRAGHDQR